MTQVVFKKGHNRVVWPQVVSPILVFLLAILSRSGAQAQTFTTLVNFDGTNGRNPQYMSLAQGTDGIFYGTTSGGGSFSNGNVFKVTSSGVVTSLYSFCLQANCTDGFYPYGSLVQGMDGNFYGTTSSGGAYSYGTVFRVTPGGTLTTIHSFNFTDGYYPAGGLVQFNGSFYGTTSAGGAHNGGTVFKITSAGVLTTLYNFCSQAGCADGSGAGYGLVQATNGNFYGTTAGGGTGDCSSLSLGNCGTIFKITPGGTLTTLHSFVLSDGAFPWAPLIQATNGNLYGTTQFGGTTGGPCGASGCGTVFKITTQGTLTTMHLFGYADGAQSAAALVQATDGNFYGTTQYGGIGTCTIGGLGGCGTIFKITSTGTFTTLHTFDASDGGNPTAGLAQMTNGVLYGSTYDSGSTSCAGGCGTLFSLTMGLAPFVETRPTSGKVGASVIILGTNLSGTTSVSFNGTAATFTMVSSSEIKTSVPVGATTGRVKVTTPQRTFSSNVAFRVTP